MVTCQIGEVSDIDASFAGGRKVNSEEDIIFYPACANEGTEEVEKVFFCKDHVATGREAYEETMNMLAMDILLDLLEEALGGDMEIVVFDD